MILVPAGKQTVDGHCIAVFSAPLDLSELSRVFSSYLKVPPLASSDWARHVPGIINEVFTQEQAERIAEGLNDKGIFAMAIARSDIPALKHSIPVGHVRCEEHGLHVLDKHGTPHLLIPWNSVETICAGAIVCANSADFPNPDGQAAHEKLSCHRCAHQSKGHLHAVVTSRSPYPPIHLKCGDVRCDFDAWQHEITDSHEFRRLVSDLGRNAADAFLTESTLDFLQDIDRDKYEFQDIEEFFRYATLQSLLARQKATMFRFVDDQ